MSMKFSKVFTPGIAQFSYLVGDTSTGTAAVIDPRPDCDVYLELAREENLSITHIFETHIHADFMSGARELAARLGTAKICVSEEGKDTKYGFEHERVKPGDVFTFGSVQVKAAHTPGHTPEHLAFELWEKDADAPWSVLTGDSLFVESAGRPDLMGEDQTEELVEQLYDTLHNYFLELPDDMQIFPCHGPGSACGPAIGDRPDSTIGYERKRNKFLQFKGDRGGFKEMVLSGAPPAPTHYPILKKVNAKGPEIMGNLPQAPALNVEAFQQALKQKDVQFVDTRNMLAFGGGHIEGAMNIGDRDELSVFAGWTLDREKPILLVAASDEKIPELVRLFWRTGFMRFAGYLAGGMQTWIGKGLPIQRVEQMDVNEVKEKLDDLQVLDVRGPDERENGYIPTSKHFFFVDLIEKTPELDKDKPVATYCATGYRASIAASILQQRGFKKPVNIPGSWGAWNAAGLPTEGG